MKGITSSTMIKRKTSKRTWRGNQIASNLFINALSLSLSKIWLVNFLFNMFYYDLRVTLSRSTPSSNNLATQTLLLWSPHASTYTCKVTIMSRVRYGGSSTFHIVSLWVCVAASEFCNKSCYFHVYLIFSMLPSHPPISWYIPSPVFWSSYIALNQMMVV